MSAPEEDQLKCPNPNVAIPVWLTAEELRQIQQQYESPKASSSHLARGSQFPYSLHDPPMNTFVLDANHGTAESQQISTIQINTLPIAGHSGEAVRTYHKKRAAPQKKVRVNAAGVPGGEGLHIFDSPATPQPKSNARVPKRPKTKLAGLEFGGVPSSSPVSTLSVTTPGINFANYSTMVPNAGGRYSTVPMQFHVDTYRNDSDYSSLSSPAVSSSKPNCRRRKQRLSNLRDLPASELQFLSPAHGTPTQWKTLDSSQVKNGQSDENAGLEELAKKLCQKQEAMELPSLLANVHSNNPAVLSASMPHQLVENGAFSALSAAIETVKSSNSVALNNLVLSSTMPTSTENVKAPTPTKAAKRVKFSNSVTIKEKKPRMTKPKAKPSKPRVPKEKSARAPAASKKSRTSSSVTSPSAAPKSKPSSSATSTSVNHSPAFMASPEKPHLSIPDLTKSPKRHAITLGRYDRRQHDMVTSDEDRTRCQYVDNYICTNRIATPDSIYCMEHFLLASKMHGIPLSKIKKSVSICAFIFKSSGAQIKCQKPVSTSDPLAKYCRNHDHDIREMKQKLMKLAEQNDYLEVLRHGCSVDLQNKPEMDSHMKPDKPSQKKTEDSSQKKAENGEINSRPEKSEAKEPDVSSQTKSANFAVPNKSVMLVSQQKFKVPGCIDLNKDEDNEGWMDYRNLTLKDIETLQLFQSDSDENSDDDEDLQGHEMLSTAGYHTTEELIRLLRDKLGALHLVYQQNRDIMKEMYLMRRRHYLEELEINKKTKTVRECSNPDMLPCNDDFPAEYIANEQIDRNNVRYLLQQGSTRGQLGLLIHKANENSQNNEKASSSSKISSYVNAMEQKPCSSKSIGGKPMHRSGKKSAINQLGVGSGKQKYPTGISMHGSDKKSSKGKNSTKVQAEGSAEPEVTATNKCSSFCCNEKPLPLTKFCQEHITKDDMQVLYISCGSLKTTSTTCETPVMDLMETKGCPIHFQEWLPDLPLSKEEKELVMAEEDKQMILPDAEESVIDSILLSQFADLSHLEEELSAALKSDYLDTDSESEESADDEKRLPPFPPVITIPDSEVENKGLCDSDEMVSDDSDGIEYVESDDNEDPFYGIVRTGQSLP